MSQHGAGIEEIARLAGHATTRTTEIVYRRELRPVITTGTEIMDKVFGPGTDLPTSPAHISSGSRAAQPGTPEQADLESRGR